MNTIAIRSAKETTTGRYYRVCGYDSTKTFTNLFVSQIRRGGEFTDYFDVSGVDYIRVCWANNRTLFEAYNGNTYQITFGQTVYSANLDVLTGILSITHGIVDMGSLSWVNDAANVRFYTRSLVNIVLPPPDNKTPIDGLCSHLILVDAGSLKKTPNCIAVGTSGNTLVYAPDYTTVEDFLNAMQGAKIVYPLATPIEIQLTPTQITTLIGENVIFADVANVTKCKFTRK